jgi:hypothetical protein
MLSKENVVLVTSCVHHKRAIRMIHTKINVKEPRVVVGHSETMSALACQDLQSTTSSHRTGINNSGHPERVEVGLYSCYACFQGAADA